VLEIRGIRHKIDLVAGAPDAWNRGDGGDAIWRLWLQFFWQTKG
jgi:hypothetical protein